MCLVSNERRENALEQEAYSLMKTWATMKIHVYLTDKTGFLFSGTHGIGYLGLVFNGLRVIKDSSDIGFRKE